MNFDVQIAHSVEQVGEDVWDKLSGDAPFHQLSLVPLR